MLGYNLIPPTSPTIITVILTQSKIGCLVSRSSMNYTAYDFLTSHSIPVMRWETTTFSTVLAI
jgi:hypothetical protein